MTIGALAIAGFSVVSGLMAGAVGGAFGADTRTVEAPPLVQVGLQQASPVQTETAVQITVPPSPTWQVATPTTSRPHTTTPSPSPAPGVSEPTSTTVAPTRTTSSENEAANWEPEVTTTVPTVTMPPLTTYSAGEPTPVE